MKHITRSKLFLKHYEKRIRSSKKLVAQVDERIVLFMKGERGKPLDDHPLTRDLSGFRAFSVTGDIRIIYHETDTVYELVDIGTHNQVYGK